MNKTTLTIVIAIVAIAVIAAAAFVLMNGNGGSDESKTCTVTFDSNGGSSVPSQTVKSGEHVTEPVSTWDGHTLNGWFTSASGGSEFDFSEAVTKSVTLYAQWTDNIKPIKTKGDFMAILDDADGYYRLMNDISLGTLPESLSIDFNGTLDGNGHEISYDFTGTASWTKYYEGDTRNVYSYGLFEGLGSDAVIRDLKVNVDVLITVPLISAQIDAGPIASTAFGGSITGCTVNGTFYLKSKLSNDCNILVGGLVGTAERQNLKVKDCVVNASLAVNAESVDIGGAVGETFSTLEVDGFKMNGEVIGLGGAYVNTSGDYAKSLILAGGVVGESMGASTVSNASISTDDVMVIRTSHVDDEITHETSDPSYYIKSIGNKSVTVTGGTNVDLSGNLGPYDEKYKGIDWNS